MGYLLPDEEIRQIEGFPDYWVTSFGRVFSAPRKGCKSWKVLKPCINKKTGYLHVGLSRDAKKHTKHIHSLVGFAFCPHTKEPGMEWTHRNDIRTDNKATNLKWDSHWSNMQGKRRGPYRDLEIEASIAGNENVILF